MRPPDLVIGPRDNPQTLRWVLFNLGGWQLALHKWMRSDEDRAPHDHKSANLSVILSPQGYMEILSEVYITSHMGTVVHRMIVPHRPKHRRWLVPYYRNATQPHRIELRDKRHVWSLWFRWPPSRRWGFWCTNGWVDADDFLAQKDYYGDKESQVGKGCG